MAGAVIASVPVLILFVFAQKQIVESVASSRGQGMTRRAGRPLVALASCSALVRRPRCGRRPAACPHERRQPLDPRRFPIDQDFPDPDVSLVDGDTVYAYATNTPAANVQCATSPRHEDLDGQRQDALPDAAVLGAARQDLGARRPRS